MRPHRHWCFMPGMRIIKAILGGERTPDVLAAMRDRRCKNSETTIARSLQGSYRPEHLFSLRQAVELYEFHQEKIVDCNRQILEQLRNFDVPDAPNDTPPSSVEEALQRMSGVDLTGIDGIDTNTALKILAEVGRFPISLFVVITTAAVSRPWTKGWKKTTSPTGF